MKISHVFISLLFLFSSPVFLHCEIVQDAHTEVELISDSASARPGQEFRAGVRFKMEPGWHIYWINPGDSGLAPKIEWKLPANWTAGVIEWPYPEKIEQPPLASYGYENEVLLAAVLKVPAAQQEGEVILKTSVKWLACQVDCIPGKAEISLPLKIAENPEADTRWSKVFSETRARIPLAAFDEKIKVFISGNKLLLRFSTNESENLPDIYFFPENPELIQHAAPQVLIKTARGYELQIRLSENYPKSVDRLRGVLFSSQGWRGRASENALSLNVPLVAASEAGMPAAPMTLITAVFFAFLGGLILNLMPCVLPVLSLKILNFIKEASENSSALFKHGLVFTAGVLVSFWFLAASIILFQAAGKYVGWGFQLQSPVFLVTLVFIFFLFALNLFGVFEIGVSLTGAGQSAASKRGLAGSFLSGIFATIVATPCTAPFMGAALGFSLAQPAWISFLVFTSLGLGMAAPYLLLCSQPGLLRFIPRPGIWMVRLKQFLGLPLLLTCVWLLWVLSLQQGNAVLKPVLTGLFLAAAGAAIYGKWASPVFSKKVRSAASAAAFLLFLSGIGLAVFGSLHGRLEKKRFQTASENKIAWEAYSEKRLEELLAEKRAVFIDFTAAWCLTCQVNERVALDAAKVVQAFSSSKIAALKADWTSQDPAITRALARYGRNSIPLYVFYEAGSDSPVLLPEILTPGAVLELLNDQEIN